MALFKTLMWTKECDVDIEDGYDGYYDDNVYYYNDDTSL